MKFIDKVFGLTLRSGNGGNGCVSFIRSKSNYKGGPDGGNGGKGGDVIFKCNANVCSLLNLSYTNELSAKNGNNGKSSRCAGAQGEDLIIKVPLGTQVYLSGSNVLIYDFQKLDEEFKILTGGRGGPGNNVFKSSTNRIPTFAGQGKSGEEICVDLLLKLQSDIAIIGMPNVGKSTFLSCLSNTKGKIANYPFSTIDPVVGSIYFDGCEYRLVDTPGLIEGGSKGRGMGVRSLSHVERTKFIIHLVDATSVSPNDDVALVRNEIKMFSADLYSKPYIICLSKCDLVSKAIVTDIIKKLKNEFKNKIFTIASNDINSVHVSVITAIKEINLIEAYKLGQIN